MYQFVCGSGRIMTSLVLKSPVGFAVGKTAKRFFVPTPARPGAINLQIQGVGPIDIPVVFTTWAAANEPTEVHFATLYQGGLEPAAFCYICSYKQRDPNDMCVVVKIGVDSAKITFVASHKDWYRGCAVEDNQPTKYFKEG